jgi:hypothetical protein
MPEAKKEYILLQTDLARAPPKTDHFSCVLDDWVESFNQTIDYLKRVAKK